ncbi:hypothetical protein PCCS19_05160 [Paenibacillus sp. CCS19]|uniref:hypothetical protein n=1 Tax=Paenibacillus sp. CCS19 TaxID=3158387 RepID=UPI00255E7C43|nr:hypothetical protein [Paenibacillus cellulosilyticus]GMK37462.1 hypothetical protein PCCS19_05160 [Paenibacillus cellulosilyticus]
MNFYLFADEVQSVLNQLDQGTHQAMPRKSDRDAAFEKVAIDCRKVISGLSYSFEIESLLSNRFETWIRINGLYEIKIHFGDIIQRQTGCNRFYDYIFEDLKNADFIDTIQEDILMQLTTNLDKESPIYPPAIF